MKPGRHPALRYALNLETSIRPISHIKSKAAEMIRQINETHNPIVITQNGKAKGVLDNLLPSAELMNAWHTLTLAGPYCILPYHGSTGAHAL